MVVEEVPPIGLGETGGLPIGLASPVHLIEVRKSWY